MVRRVTGEMTLEKINMMHVGQTIDFEMMRLTASCFEVLTKKAVQQSQGVRVMVAKQGGE